MLLRLCIFLLVISSANASPFGVLPAEPGFRPDDSWLGQILGILIQWQSQFQAQILQYFSLITTDSAAQMGLLLACFLYGVVHSIGPGHGKVVMASWLVAQRHARLNVAVAFSVIAAMTQASVAIALITIVFFALDLTQAAIGKVIYSIDLIAGSMIVLLGLRLLWRCISSLKSHHKHLHHHAGCSCNSLTEGAEQQLHTAGELVFAAVMAGLRPCTGALLVLTLAFSKQAAIWGVLGVLLMGIGVSCGLLIMAVIVVFTKHKLDIQADSGSTWIGNGVRVLEICAAVILLFWGCTMIFTAL